MKGRGECCGGRGRLGAEVRAVDKRGEAVCRGEFVGGDGWGVQDGRDVKVRAVDKRGEEVRAVDKRKLNAEVRFVDKAGGGANVRAVAKGGGM